MASQSQNYSNHARFYPPWHFVAAPILLINVVVATVSLVRSPSWNTGWGVAVAVALLLTVFTARSMSSVNQDRIIRNEERMRLERLLPEARQAEIPRFTVPQLVALRFASDEELPALSGRVTAGELTDQKSIKQAIKQWRADVRRV